ncbi:hypothetical protein E2542_SST21890 [Spatholobus suberectus]|nr:hypothetical protein E2542_SST21890 [Spatholobus suberectus]
MNMNPKKQVITKINPKRIIYKRTLKNKQIPRTIIKNEMEQEDKSELEQWRRCITQEGPSSSSTAARIAVTDSVFDLVESMLEHSEPEQQPDRDHHQNQARAKHAHPPPTAHLSPMIDECTKVLAFLFWVFRIWEIRVLILFRVMGNWEDNAEFKKKEKIIGRRRSVKVEKRRNGS